MRREKAITACTDIGDGTTEDKTTIKLLGRVAQTKKKLNSAIFIAGFLGAGLVGSISTSYIMTKLPMIELSFPFYFLDLLPCSLSSCVSILKLSLFVILPSDSIRIVAPSGSGIPLVASMSML
jgi:hypothetical protein